ncbi:hypothetical protein [Clostridium sp. HBUAS56010]|uniref:hypothetical protein n=1 Tax=Clostridium sp. HBUAS56010 TaxID=2571127 RepID=UPI0011781F97|nr:hypothetical protein [Clostridium sp. HBUAS56010]
MENITIDEVKFKLREYHDFQWVHKYGKVFCVFDQTGSGCIGFGVENRDKRYFIKVAGVHTMEAEIDPGESVKVLKEAVKLYEILDHPNLIRIREHFPVGELYAAVFDWAEGECLYDHWNFDYYKDNPLIKSPSNKFKELPIWKKFRTVDTLFSFLELTAEKNYVAVDFYDGSIIYDFNLDATMICDIDFFREKPAFNDMGEQYWGSKRLKAPEEYILHESIDERTNVFTLGALIFHFFGGFTEQEIKLRYKNNCFSPCCLDRWELNDKAYEVLVKAVAGDRLDRYQTVKEFRKEWTLAVSEI